MKTIINRQKSYGGWILLKTFVLCPFLLFGVMVQTLGAESGDIKVDGIYYHISNNGTASVIASLQNSYGGNVVIPESLLYQGEKYIVRGISEKSFYNCRYLTSVSYGAQNEAYNVERGRKTPKVVYLQRVARVEAMRSAQNETFT